MINEAAWQELVATLALRQARAALAHVTFNMPVTVEVPYEEIESCPDMEVIWDGDAEVVRIRVVP